MGSTPSSSAGSSSHTWQPPSLGDGAGSFFSLKWQEARDDPELVPHAQSYVFPLSWEALQGSRTGPPWAATWHHCASWGREKSLVTVKTAEVIGAPEERCG